MTIRIYKTAIRYWCVLVLLFACLASGCAHWDVKETFSKPLFGGDDGDPKVPARVVAVWVDTVRYTQGEAPTRGFGGRLVFYKEGEDKPVKVDGDLVVYAFDEDGRKPTDPRPTRKYVFRADQLDIHYSESKVGHSYSFFLPWDKVGGYQKEVSLIVRFQPKRGPVVVSEQTRHLLPGKPLPEQTQVARPAEKDDGGVRPASFNSSSIERNANAARERMKSTTIPLPSTFGQQTPRAEILNLYRQARAKGSAAASQGLPENSTPESSTDSRPSGSRPRVTPTFRREGGRALSLPRREAWQSPRRSTLPGGSGSESS